MHDFGWEAIIICVLYLGLTWKSSSGRLGSAFYHLSAIATTIIIIIIIINLSSRC